MGERARVQRGLLTGARVTIAGRWPQGWGRGREVWPPLIPAPARAGMALKHQFLGFPQRAREQVSRHPPAPPVCPGGIREVPD